MKRLTVLTLIPVLALFAFLPGCSNDDNPTNPEKFGEISGTVKFVGAWPQVGDVQVSVWVNWPPAGHPAAATDPLPTGKMEQTYKIDGLSLGTYPVVTVGWRDPAKPAEAKILGVYWANPDSVGIGANGFPNVQPTPIQISEDNLVWKDINIKADLDLVK